jgi:serine/threonine-protein kinase
MKVIFHLYYNFFEAILPLSAGRTVYYNKNPELPTVEGGMQLKSILLDTVRIDEGMSAFLQRIGTVFKVFDKQDSGCVSYGVRIEGTKWFVKHTERPEAIQWMRNAVSFNSELLHRCLPRLRNAFDTANGFALVYDWVEGEVLGTPDFPGAEGRNRPESPHYRFRQLPVRDIVAMLSDLYGLHAEIEAKGYVGVDFYDGCILYDFTGRRSHFCDFDHYVKGPFHLQADRNYGSSRFMAPEEFVRGSLIDHRTNVYTMGAAAFVFLADGLRSSGAWKASDELFKVAAKAVSPERDSRHDSLKEFYDDWNAALGAGPSNAIRRNE